MKKIIIAIIVVLVLIVIYGFSAYNSLVTANINADTQWKQVEVDYQRRFDLIPNLVAATKGALTQEKAIFTAIADARTRYSGATTVNEKAQAAGQVESALARLLVVVENYPTLKSLDSIQALNVDVTGTENRISVERRRFNESVREYNLKVMRFPSSVVASIFGFDERSYFEVSEGAAVAPKVEL